MKGAVTVAVQGQEQIAGARALVEDGGSLQEQEQKTGAGAGGRLQVQMQKAEADCRGRCSSGRL